MTMLRNGQLLRATSTAASYDFLGQFISLDSFTRQEVEAATGLDSSGRKVLGLILHEATHWSDHLSTLWGADLLVRTYEGYEARHANEPERLWKIADAWRSMRTLHLPEYYRTVFTDDQTVVSQRPWVASPTLGRGYSHAGKIAQRHPLLFYRFSSRSDEVICRAPFTTGALAELNATAAEYELTRFHLASVADQNERIAEQKLVQRQILDHLYNPALVEYSVCAHWVANRLSYSDVFAAFRVGFALSTLALNVGKAAAAKLRRPDIGLLRHSPDDHAALIRSSGPAYTFVCLASAAERVSPKGPDLAERDWLRDVAREAGLPKLVEIESVVRADRENLRIRANGLSKFGARAATLLAVGDEILETRGILGLQGPLRPFIDESGFCLLPPLLLGDGSVLTLGKPAMDVSAVVEWYAEFGEVERQMHEFLDACFAAQE